jgi:acyl-CoA synthetase (AMP-forming)/AMP-acid ligase II
VKSDKESGPSPLSPPSILFKGVPWSSDELRGMALGWLDPIHDALGADVRATGIVLANSPEAMALFFALSTLRLPLVVLPAEPRSWRSLPPFPSGVTVFLLPSQRELARRCETVGLRAQVLPARSAAGPQACGEAPFLTLPGLVTFTSGSTGLPKSVYIATRSLLLQTAAIVATYRLPAGCGIAGSLPLASHYGLGHTVFLPTVLEARLGLLERFDHRSLLALFGSGDYSYWAGTPLMADLLARAPGAASVSSCPPLCHISAGRLPGSVFRAFRERFGVPLRPSYGRTENGFITAESSPPDEVRPEAVGRPVDGIEIRIGDDPREPVPPGQMGRVWFTSAWYMEGYGFPPRLAPREGRDGWWATEDIGTLDESGYLTLVGRTDECFKTPSGYLVNPAEIARVLTEDPRVADVAVFPVPAPAGPVIGVLAEGDGDPSELRARVVRTLPSWLWPKFLAVTRELPRLSGGKVDRQACIAILGASHDQGRAVLPEGSD